MLRYTVSVEEIPPGHTRLLLLANLLLLLKKIRHEKEMVPKK